MALTMAQTYALARQAGFDPAAAVIMTAIAMGESGLDPAAVGDVSLQTATWGPSVGLTQIRTLKADTGTGKTRDVQRLSDPLQNLVAAFQISSGGKDFTPWTVFTSGKYRQWLGQATTAAGTGGAVVPGATVVQPVSLAGDVGTVIKDTSVLLTIVGLGVVLIVAGAVTATGTGDTIAGAAKGLAKKAAMLAVA